MSNSTGKRKSQRKMECGANMLIDIDDFHNYSSKGATAMVSEDFPSEPLTPEKPPVKKGKAEMAATDIIGTLSQLINTRSDELKKIVEDNTAHITSLRGDVEAICQQMGEVKNKVEQLDVAFEGEKKRVGKLESRITELERYSRRWNLKLHGVSEQVDDKNVRQEVIRICQEVVPEEAEHLPYVIDSVHCVGEKRENSHRSIILRFSTRVMRDTVWAAAKKCTFLQNNGLRFAEDLCKADRESRKVLWPFVDSARKNGKQAYFVGGRAFIEKKEIPLPEGIQP